MTGGRTAAFADEEYAARRARVQERLAERGWSALVVADPANLYYLCGYDAWSFYVPQCLVLPAEGEPHLLARTMDAAGATRTARLRADQVHGYPETLVHRPDVHPYEWMARRALELGVLRNEPDAVVAAELDAHYLTARGYLALTAVLDRARVVDSGELVNWVRLVKSPAEVAALRTAGRIAGTAMVAALEGVRAGRRQCDVVAEILAAQARGTDEAGGDYPAIFPMLPSGEAADTPHLTWTDEPFPDGTATTIELAGAYRRYHAPLARTVSLGRPPKRLAACADVVAEGLDATLAVLRPGRVAADAHRAFTDVLGRHGMAKESRIGYSIGIGYPPDWGERTVSVRADDGTELEAGMAFHLILGMWMDGWGYETSESVVLSASGAERLTDVPQGLTTKE